MTEPEAPTSAKKKWAIGGAAGVAALITALATFNTSLFGTKSENTAITRNDTPIVINRPTDANGSPKPVTVLTQKAGPPIVIVGNGAPEPCPTPTQTPTRTPTPRPAPSPSPTPTPTCVP